MFFGKKSNKNDKKCEICSSKISSNFNFCPYCGSTLNDKEKDEKDFGMLGKFDSHEDFIDQNSKGLGITDKLISSLMNSVMKNLDKQFREMENNTEKELGKAEVKSFPNGIRIKIGSPSMLMPEKRAKKQSIFNKPLTNDQIKKMSSLPRTEAKTNVRRLSDKVVYEINAPGIESTNDVFVSKLETGYEVKAIGSKKVYVNSIPINLPIKRFLIDKNKLLVEFNTQEEASLF